MAMVQVTSISAASNFFVFFTIVHCIDSQPPYIAETFAFEGGRGFGSEKRQE